QAAVNYAVGSFPHSVTVGDFDGDGKPDLATANENSANASVLLTNGDGTFQAAVNYAAGTNPFSVAAGDFNSDGKSDLAVVTVGNSVNLLLGKGDGTFQMPVSYAAGLFPDSIAVGDFNGDGKPDVATTNANGNDISSNTVSVLLNQGWTTTTT